MSIKIMSSVWEHSKQKGAPLLLLLALSDFANDDGEAWPSQRTLARKIRMSKRYTQILLDELIKAKEIRRLSVGTGIGHSSRYKILIKRTRPAGQLTKGRGPQASFKGRGGPRLTVEARRPNPSLTVINPPAASAAAAAASPPRGVRAVADATGAAAAAAWSWIGLKVRKPGNRNATAEKFVSQYLYATTQIGINRPAMWAIKVAGNGAGGVFDELAALGPRGLAEVLAWITKPSDQDFFDLASEYVDLLPRDHLARCARAIQDLGLHGLVAQAEKESAARKAADSTASDPVPAGSEPTAWDLLLGKMRLNGSASAAEALRSHCRFIRDDEGELLVQLPSALLAWIHDRGIDKSIKQLARVQWIVTDAAA